MLNYNFFKDKNILNETYFSVSSINLILICVNKFNGQLLKNIRKIRFCIHMASFFLPLTKLSASLDEKSCL